MTPTSPPLTPVGTQRCHLFKSAPHEGSDSLRLMFLFSIAAARKTIHLANAYFMPDDLTIQTMIEARQRGVKIDILVPGPHIDKAVRARGVTRTLGRSLRGGSTVLRVPTDHVSHEAHGGGRHVDERGQRQLRQSLFPPER